MITKDMLIMDALKAGDPDKIATVLQESGMHCLHCMLAHGETMMRSWKSSTPRCEVTMYGNDIAAISARLKELRTFSDYTTAQVAEMLGVDEEEYVAYESGTKEIPINLIYKFADVMETEAAYVMSGVLPSKDKVYVVYDGKGMSVKRYEGYSFTSLGGDFRKKTMNPMLVTIAPTDTPELVVHGGQEIQLRPRRRASRHRRQPRLLPPRWRQHLFRPLFPACAACDGGESGAVSHRHQRVS